MDKRGGAFLLSTEMGKHWIMFVFSKMQLKALVSLPYMAKKTDTLSFFSELNVSS